MEDSVKDQPTPVSVPGKSKLRYPLRSAAKPKEEKPPASDFPGSSTASRRGRQASSVSKSVSVLDISSKDKSSSSASAARPPRRLSVPVRSAAGKATGGAGGIITPISENRVKRQSIAPAKSETPLSDASRASARRKFSTLSSASYWLSQIKLSESAAKHSISLGFFKLALDAGCQPLQRMRDELKSYIGRYELNEHGEIVKELLEKYNMSGNEEQVQVSETFSQIPEEGTRSSDDEVRSSSSTIGARSLRPRSLNTNAAKVSAVKDSANKVAAPRTRGGSARNGSASTKSISDAGERRVQKKPQRSIRQDAGMHKDQSKMQGKKSPIEKGPASPRDYPEENKENMDDQPVEETRLVEAV